MNDHSTNFCLIIFLFCMSGCIHASGWDACLKCMWYDKTVGTALVNKDGPCMTVSHAVSSPYVFALPWKENDLNVTSQMSLPILGKNSNTKHVMLIRSPVACVTAECKVPSLKTRAMTLIQKNSCVDSSILRPRLAVASRFPVGGTEIKDLPELNEALPWFKYLHSTSKRAVNLFRTEQGRTWNYATTETTGTCAEMRCRNKRDGYTADMRLTGPGLT